MLKAYKTQSTRRALRVSLISDYLDKGTLKKYCGYLDCVGISTDMYISLYLPSRYPIINIDEYFIYADLMNIDITKDSKEREESFSILLEILQAKYGIEYVAAEN